MTTNTATATRPALTVNLGDDVAIDFVRSDEAISLAALALGAVTVRHGVNVLWFASATGPDQFTPAAVAAALAA